MNLCEGSIARFTLSPKGHRDVFNCFHGNKGFLVLEEGGR